MNENKKKLLKERRFECQQCGYCCSQKVLIYPSLEEIQNLAQYLNLSEYSFALRYLQEIYDPQKDSYAIAFRTNQPNDPFTGCIFCQDKICMIHDSPRTNLCHVFPWNHFDLEKEEWEENFISEDGTFWCSGIGKGRLWTLEEIKTIKETYPNIGVKTKRLYNPSPPSGPQNIDMCRPSNIMMTMSEERFIHKLRSLPITRKIEVEKLLDFFYHGGHKPH
jgi:Fe-S-cluster containining protein